MWTRPILWVPVLAAAAGVIILWLLPSPMSAYARDIRSLGARARTAWNAEPPWHRWTLLLLLVLGVLLRVLLMNQRVRYDEAWSFLYYSSQSLHTALSDYSLPNNHVFHTLLSWTSIRIFGDALWAIRLPAFIAGVLLVPATYALTRKLAGSAAALMAAAFAAVMPSLLLYSTNARGYTILCLAFLLQLLLADALAESDSPALWIAFACVTALGLFTAPVMLYPSVTSGLWIVIERWRRGRMNVMRTIPRIAAAVVLTLLLTAILYAPVIARFGAKVIVSSRFVTAENWGTFQTQLSQFGQILYATFALGLPAAFAGAVVVASIAALFGADTRRQARVTLAISAALGCVVVLLATRHVPPGRVMLYLVPLICAYAGAGVATILAAIRLSPHQRSLAACGLALVLTVSLGAYGAERHVVEASEETDWIGFHDAQDVARYLQSELRTGDRLVMVEVGVPVEFYMRALGGHRVAEFTRDAPADRVLVVVNEEHGQTLDLIRSRRTRVPWNGLSQPHVLRKFAHSSVYELRAQPTAAPPVQGT